MSIFKSRIELSAAVSEKNAKRVKEILSSISVVDDLLRDELGLLLHEEHATLDIAKLLLSYGANVRKYNGLRDTPLHSAIFNHRDPEFIELLLRYGASTNSSNYRGNTPLYVALKEKNRNLSVIKLLLEYGADINILNRERRVDGNHYSSLQYSMFDLGCVKLLVKLTLFKYFNENYIEKINLDSLRKFKNFIHVSKYFDDCIFEINEMNCDLISDKTSLYELISSDEKDIQSSEKVSEYADLVISRIIGHSYPIYNDLILTSNVAKKCFLHKVDGLKFYAAVDEKNVIFLNRDLVFAIVQYLSNKDLLNFILSFSCGYSIPSNK